MRWGPKAIAALLALACVGGAACGGGGGGGSTIITTQSSFPQGFLPVLFASSVGSGDVTIRFDGDLYAVDGQTSDVTVVSRVNGSVATFANDVGGASNVLVSIIVGFGDDGRLFAGDADGEIWAIAANGTATLFVDTGTNQPITGLAFAPIGFGDFGGQLFAAAGSAGIRRIGGDPTQALPFATGTFVDLAFSGATLFAIDATSAEIDTVSAGGTTASFQGGFDTPVGITVDTTASEIYIADAGDDVLYTVPVAGGTPTARADYSFDSAAPSGLSYDGFAAIAFVTADPPAIRGSALPRIDPANPFFGLAFSGPTVGYGDLELDRLGAFVLAANDPDDPPAGDSINNFLFSVSRDAATVTVLASGVGSPVEELLGVAADPYNQVIYFSTRSGNVWKRDAAGAVSMVVSVSASAVLGLELVPLKGVTPFQFDPHGSIRSDPLTVDVKLAATTSDGHVFVVDPKSATAPRITSAPIGSRLSDLVFAADGTLYVVDNGTTTSRILRVAPNGTATNLGAPTVQLGRPDGIEIDEGGNRLLVASETAGGGRLLAVDRDSGAVAALANIAIDDSFFPTGVVYDRLGTAVVRERDDATSLRGHSVAPFP